MKCMKCGKDLESTGERTVCPFCGTENTRGAVGMQPVSRRRMLLITAVSVILLLLAAGAVINLFRPGNDPSVSAPAAEAEEDEAAPEPAPDYLTVSGVSFSGSLSTRGQIDRYLYTAPQSGRYFFGFVKDRPGGDFSFTVTDSSGRVLNDSSSYLEGAAADLTDGRTYYIEISWLDDPVDYTVTIGMPWEEKEITGDVISSRLTYKDQRDVYTYTAPVSGKYRFTLDISDVECAYSFELRDGKNAVLTSAESYTDGRTAELTEGETYTVIITQYDGLADYTVTIGVPSVPRAVTGESFGGSITYTDQQDRYTLSAPVTGRYWFGFVPGDADFLYSFELLDDKKASVAYSNSYREGRSAELEAGREYSILITYDTGFGDYSVTVGVPRETSDVSGREIRGEITFPEQQDLYRFTPDATRTYVFTMSGPEGGEVFYFRIWDAGGILVAGGSSYRGQVEAELTAGGAYIIEIEQSEGCPAYEITIS